MNETSKGPRYLMRWDHSRDYQLAREIMVTSHRLGELDGLFGPRLADIIDAHPREALTLAMLSDDPRNPAQRLYGELGKFCGGEIVEMIRRGQLWLSLADLQTHHAVLRRLISRLYGELRECHPGLRTFAESGQLRISSPSTPTQFHFDLAPIVHWNVRGCRRVWVYPLEESCLPRLTLEELVSGNPGVTLEIDPAFDDRAQVFDLQPGQMISIPQYMPHRIENRDGLNVTLVTRHMTPVAERHNNVHRANRLLRPLIPAAANHDRVSGVTAVIKDAIVRLLLSKSQDISVDPATEKTFCLDPDAPNCVKPLSTPGDVATTTAGPMITSFGLETTTSTSSAVLEH